MKAANLHAINDLRYEEMEKPTCLEDEVLVEIKACGVCGSDIPRVFTKGTYHFPTVIGHEFSGIVVEDKTIPNAMPRCPYCGEMPYSTEECVFCGQRFTEESAMQGNLPPEPIKYKSENGYTGVLYGWHSFSIRDKRGKEVFHTGSRSFDTYEELVERVEEYPEFVKKILSIDFDEEEG